METAIHALRIWISQIRYTLIREMMFKANLFIWFLCGIVWFATNIYFVELLYSHVDDIAGWKKWEVILLVATANLSVNLYHAFFTDNFIQFSELVRTGRLDFYLALPFSTQFLVSTRLFALDSFAMCILSILLAVYAGTRIPVEWSVANVSGYLALTVAATMVHYAIVLMLVTLSVWLKRESGLHHLYYNFFHMSRVPRQAYRGITAILFTWLLPMLLIANVPAETLIRGWNMPDAVSLIAIALFLLWVSRQFFQFGLRYYGSASS
jgi:ABC-2 type transport system permease protein